MTTTNFFRPYQGTFTTALFILEQFSSISFPLHTAPTNPECLSKEAVDWSVELNQFTGVLVLFRRPHFFVCMQFIQRFRFNIDVIITFTSNKTERRHERLNNEPQKKQRNSLKKMKKDIDMQKQINLFMRYVNMATL